MVAAYAPGARFPWHMFQSVLYVNGFCWGNIGAETNISMENYGEFIWSAYGATAILLVMLLGHSILRYRIARRQLDECSEND